MTREELLVEMYKPHSNQAQGLISTVDSMNGFFAALTSFYLPFTMHKGWVFSLVGVGLCFIWWYRSWSMGRLKDAKTKALQTIERELGYSFYDKEENRTSWTYQCHKN